MPTLNVSRQEYRHHDDEQIQDAFAWAVAMVGELGVDERHVGALIVKAVELRTSKQIVFEQVSPTGIRIPGLPAH